MNGNVSKLNSELDLVLISFGGAAAKEPNRNVFATLFGGATRTNGGGRSVIEF